MSPEIVEKRGYEGGPSDCWSLGVLLYTIIHKRGPFGDNDDKDLNINIRKCGYVIDEGVPDLTKDLIQNLLVKQPHLRLTPEEILGHEALTSIP